MKKELLTTKYPSALQLTAARGALVFAMLYSVLLLALHVVKPELDPTWRFISEYALGPYGWMMTITFVCISLSLLATVFAIGPHVKKWYGYIGLFFFCLSAVGYMIAAIFPTDPVTVDQSALSDSGQMHMLGASLDLTPVATFLVAFSLARTELWNPKKKTMLVVAFLILVLNIAFIISVTSAPNGVIGPGVYAGLIGRFILWSYALWTATLSLHVINTLTSTLRSPPVILDLNSKFQSTKHYRQRNHYTFYCAQQSPCEDFGLSP